MHSTGSDTINPVKPLNLAFRFLLEVAALVAFASWGWQSVDPAWLRLVLAVVTPLAAALLWGRFIAPQAGKRLPDPLRAGVEVAFFGAATAALAVVGAGTIAVTYGGAAALSLALMFVFDQRGM
jgi:hypothetical protein